MKELPQDELDSGLNLNDILYILFRRKWFVLVPATLGIFAAAIYYFQFQEYESQAKLMVRYVLERSVVDKLDTGPEASFSTADGERVINAETEILTSADLALQVAESVGAKRLLPDAKDASSAAAAGVVSGGLKVTSKLGSNVLTVTYRHPDRRVAQSVLDTLVNQYFDKHLQVHRSLGSFAFVAKQTEQVSSQLHQTEEELKRLKTNSGIVTLADSSATLTNVLSKSQQELDEAEVQRAEQRARIQEMEKWVGGAGVNPARVGAEQPNNRNGAQDYQFLGMRLDDMRNKERELLSKYTSESPQVRAVNEQIQEIASKRRALEISNPSLAGMSSSFSTPITGAKFDLATEKAHLASLEAKTDTLSSQLQLFQQKAEQLSKTGIEIAQLERKREVEEANYKYFQASLEKARIDEALDPSKIPNISVVQSPTEGRREFSHTGKILLGLCIGGLAFGLLLAFFMEKVVDRTIKRPLEIDSKLGLPLLVSIPHIPFSANLRLPLDEDAEESPATLQDVARSELGHQILPYVEAIRDRLILYFKLNRLVRKPKLIAVTALTHEAGISTVADGLAATLSETGDGKVLLVNMNVGHTETQAYTNGNPTPSLVEILQTGVPDESLPTQNLYLATIPHAHAGCAQFAPKHFYDLIPHIKTSAFDYIIFDMPPLTQTSATVALAGFMDKVLLVVEAGKTNPETLKRAYNELSSAKADVSCVFNKARSCAPKGIEGDM